MNITAQLTKSFGRYKSIIPDWNAFCETLQKPLPTCIWANPLRLDNKGLKSWLEDENVCATEINWLPNAFLIQSDTSVGNLLGYTTGLFHVQEAVSQLPAMMLNPDSSDRILDLCAAPGNKTVQAGVQMNNRGTVVANDRSAGRLFTLANTAQRLGLVNISTTRFDAANYPPAAGLFDKIIADVPCSCEGTSRKNPEVLAKCSIEYSTKLAGAQRAILRKAVQLCKPGGTIIYSTCTYAPEENEAVLDDVLNHLKNGEIEIMPTQIEGLISSAGLTKWQEQTFHPSIKNALRIWPHQNDTGGFFIAKIKRN